MKVLQDMFQNKKILYSLSLNDFKKKYAGSFFGFIWAFVHPIITTLIYWFVFEKGLKAGHVSGDIPFIVWLICGLVPWFFYADAVSNATVCYSEYSYLVKKVVFNISLLPVVKIISAFFVHIFFVLFMLLFIASYGYGMSWMTIQILYYSFCLLVNIYVVVLITSTIQPFFKDLTQIVAIFLQVFFWFTPILWSTDILSKNLEIIFKLNPLYYIIIGYRDSLLYNVAFWEHPALGIYFWVINICFLILGIKLLHLLKDHFADVL